MRRLESLIGVHIGSIAPPYHHVRSCPCPCGTDHTEGSVHLVSANWDTDNQVVRFAQRLRQSSPAIPVVLTGPDWRPIATMNTAVESRDARGAGISSGWPAVDLHALRRTLTDADDLEEELVPVMMHTARQLTYYVAADIRSVIGGGRSLSARERRQIGRRLQKAGVPPPAQWTSMVKALRAAMAIQRLHDHSLNAIAYRVGYAEASSMCRQISSCFGVRTTYLRCTLGWQWLAKRWCTKQLLT